MALASVFGEGSREWRKAHVQGYRHGKHNGYNAGAFGGKNKASFRAAHRT